MSLRCQPPCPEKFGTKRSLEQHQRHCVFQQDDHQLLGQNLSEKWVASQARKKRKRDDAKKASEAQEDSAACQPIPDVDMVIVVDDPPQARQSEIKDLEQAPVPAVPPPLPGSEQLGRSHRIKRPTWKVLQSLPEPPPLPEPPAKNTPDQPNGLDISDTNEQPQIVCKAVHTLTNAFGLFRKYPSRPTHNPDDFVTLEDLTDASTGAAHIPLPPPTLPDAGRLSNRNSEVSGYSFPSSTVGGLLQWAWTGSPLKSLSELGRLLNFLRSDAFNQEDLQGVDIQKETEKLDQWLSGGHNSSRQDGWRQVEVDIVIPDGVPHPSYDSRKDSNNGETAPTFCVPGLHLRSLVEVIKAAFKDPASRSFHYTPFKEFWTKTPASTDLDNDVEAGVERLHGELYTSDAMIQEHTNIQNLPPEKDDPEEGMERVVAAMMFWSDSTHLANFGNASLWPVYLFFGNQSKYDRAKPQSAACHHVAYIPKLPDTFNDFYHILTDRAPDAEVLSHCRRELMHRVWELLLDDQFLEAYEHGIVLECPDGIKRRFYPRIFTYSADYPEKVLLGTIRNGGSCPCPRCLLPKEQIFEIGTINDSKRRERLERSSEPEQSYVKRARDWIYGKGMGIKSKAVEGLLFAKSLVPTINAFSRLSAFCFNIHKALVVDLMHEDELGVWKALYTHLIRILHALGATIVQEFNRRFRMVPTFGVSTIRRFSDDAAAMKKMAARNFEDLLLCSLPVFEGLLPEPYNSEVLSLLYTMAEWHTLAKLRLHTSSTLSLLHEATSELGRLLRRFRSFTCTAFSTKELPSEAAKRDRQAARKRMREGASTTPANVNTTTVNRLKSSNKKEFSLSTYKLHALGDYARTIEWFGTTDSYSTQTGELEHRRVKRFYARTNKNDAVKQMTRLERRDHALSKLPEPSMTPTPNKSKGPAVATASRMDALVEVIPHLQPSAHYQMSDSRNSPVNITTFLADHVGDPAITHFLPKLKKHLLWRLLNPGYTPTRGSGDSTSEELASIQILNNRLFEHKIFRVNYTTYDLRRAYDSINAANHADIMCLSRNEDAGHPFEYARLLRLFHIQVIHQVPGGSQVTHTFDVLFVRRYGLDMSYRAGFKRKRLHRIQFLPHEDPEAFGFIDPDEVIRSAHILPAFHYRETTHLLSGQSLARAPDEKDDWLYFYVNIFADRDMYMRYRGGGVGHYQVPLAEDDSDDCDLELPLDSTEALGGTIQEEVNDLGEVEESDASDSSESEGEDENVVDTSSTDLVRLTQIVEEEISSL